MHLQKRQIQGQLNEINIERMYESSNILTGGVEQTRRFVEMFDIDFEVDRVPFVTLIASGEKDGYHFKYITPKCQNMEKTIVLVRSLNFKRVFGVFVDVPWA